MSRPAAMRCKRGGSAAKGVAELTPRCGEAESAEVLGVWGRAPSFRAFSALSVSLRLCVRLFADFFTAKTLRT